MKKTKKLLSSIIALSMAAQGIVSVVNVSAATTGISGKSMSIDFEEYQDGQLPSGTGWSFEKLPSGVEANTFFKVETIKDIDGVDTQAIVFNSRPDAENPYTFSDAPMLKYTFSQPITGDYIEAKYDIRLTPISNCDYATYQWPFPACAGFAEVDTEGKTLTKWGKPAFIDRFYDLNSDQKEYRFSQSTQEKTIDSNSIKYIFSLSRTDSKWLRVRKIYNRKEKTYSLWVNGQSMGTYDMVFPTPGSGLSTTNGEMGGLGFFSLYLDKDLSSNYNITAAVDNISVNVLENYDPSAVSFDFESDSLDVMPASVKPSVKLNGTALNTTKTEDLAKLNQMIKVESVTGRDGKQTKALHLQSQPTAETTYDYSEDARALISFNNVETTDTKKCIEVSYDIKVIPTVSVDGELANTGFVPYHMKNGAPERETVSGKTHNEIHLYLYTGSTKKGVANWKTRSVKDDKTSNEYNYDLASGYYNTANGEIVPNHEGKWIKFTTIYDLEQHTFTVYQDNVVMKKDIPMPMWNNGSWNASTAVGFNAFQTMFARRDDVKIDYYVDNISAKPVDYKYKEGFTWDFEEVEVGKLPEGVTATSQAKLNSVTVAGDEIFNVQTTTDKYGNNTKALRFESKQSKDYVYADNNNATLKIDYDDIEANYIETSYDIKIEPIPIEDNTYGFLGGGNIFSNSNGKEAINGKPVNGFGAGIWTDKKPYLEFTYYEDQKTTKPGYRIFTNNAENTKSELKWTNIKQIYNLKTHKYTLYIDGEEKLSNVGMNQYLSDKYYDTTANKASLFVFWISTQYLKTHDLTYYIDNISVRGIKADTIKDIYVSTVGNANNSGKTEAEAVDFATAKTMAHEASASCEEVTVHIAAGTYTDNLTFTAADSAVEGSKIIYKAEGNVVFTGEQAVSATAFTPATDVGENIYVADISGEFAEKSDYGFGDRNNALYYGLIQNGEQRTLAKYPNYGYMTPAEGDVVNTENGTYTTDAGETKNYYTATITIPEDKAQKWAGASDLFVEGFIWNGWGYMGRNAQIDSGKIKIDSVSKDKYNYPRITVSNLLEELDVPGEYYIDRTNKKLYYYPINDDLSGISLVTNTTEKIKVDGAANLVFDGIDVKNTKGYAYNINNSTNITIQNAEITNIYAPYAVNITGGSDVTVDKCTLHELPAGGIYVDAGSALDNFTNGNVVVSNSEMYNFALERKTYYPAVNLKGCGNKVTNCVIHDAPHSAIIFAGNDHVIEYCDISNVVTESVDAGAIYAGRSWVNAGTEIRYNKFHDIKRFDVPGDNNKVSAIFFDDMLCGNKVIGNLFENVSTAVVVSGGKGVEIVNNVIKDCNEGVYFSNPNDKYVPTYRNTYDAFRAENFVNEDGALNATYTVWVDKYPYLDSIENHNDGSKDYDFIADYAIYTGNVAQNTDTFYYHQDVIDNAATDDNDIKQWNDVETTTNYTETNTWNAISAEIAKVAENVTKTTAEGATFTLFTPVMTTAGAEFVWLNHNRIGLDKLVVATDESFTNKVAEITTNSNGAKVSDITRGTTYYWKVVAADSFGTSAESSVSTYKAEKLIIGTITLSETPAAGKTITATIPVDKTEDLTGVVVAVCKEDGRIVAINNTSIVNGTTTVNFTVPTTVTGTLTSEFYFWDSLNGMMPLAKAVKLGQTEITSNEHT